MSYAAPRSLVALLLCALTALFLPACENAEEEIDLTVSELEDAMARRNGAAFVALIAPESFTHYDRMIQLALNATLTQLQPLSIMEKLEIVVMRNRMKRKELEAMDGRGWIAKCVNEGWAEIKAGAELEVHKRTITVRGSNATVEIMYDVRWGLGQGADSLDRVRETMSFIKVDDRWLYDYRRQSDLLEKALGKAIERFRVTPEQAIERIESNASDKDVSRDIWKPMK